MTRRLLSPGWSRRLSPALAAFFLLAPFAAGGQKDKQDKSDNEALTNLRIEVTAGDENKPVAEASVYVRFSEERRFRKDKHIEMNLKTDQQGVAAVKDVPRRTVLIQVVAPGWKTFGKYYKLDKDEVLVKIHLDKPPHWY